ncbi:T9SS type A sorting domain-containing protein [Rhodothermus profundi]|uniref:Por secretion system C-terminal sorting domain-containing protein n=1 Tax=Rhodothermus profundi TaxID=633813 RepID=A0A1M6T061_9BACT|nr:T9SS type A sorting domain-containing protein [Rhodothermus profundi]SHK50363.1 Por secretion system C-terminal sorting domain-containing protein [Rhodothermus profundi]
MKMHCYAGSFLIVILLISGSAQAQVTAVRSGNWSDPATWSTGAVPTENDDVVIADSTVLIDLPDAKARNVTVRGSGRLRYQRDPSLNGFGLTVYGDLVIEGPNAEFRPLTQVDPATGQGLGIVYHRLFVHGNIDNSTGGTFDLRRGSTSADPPTASFVDLHFVGSGDSHITLGPYDKNKNQLFQVFIQKEGGARVVLGSDVTQDNNSRAKLHLENGYIVTNEYRWRVFTNSASGIVGGSPASYVIGALSRGIPKSGEAYERVFPVGDENGYRPVTIYSSDVVPDDQDFEVRVISADADPGGATLEGGLTDVSPVRYYAFTMYERDSADPYTVDRIAISYGEDDQVPEGSSAFVVATSVDENRMVWRNSGGIDPVTGQPHVTSLAAPPTLIQSDVLTDFTFEITVVPGEPPQFARDTYYAAMGTTDTFVTATEQLEAVSSFRVGAAYPNPFQRATRMALELLQAAQVQVRVYDLLGREVARLAEGMWLPGTHMLEWKPEGTVAPGMYLIRVEVGAFSTTRKVVVIR